MTGNRVIHPPRPGQVISSSRYLSPVARAINELQRPAGEADRGTGPQEADGTVVRSATLDAAGEGVNTLAATLTHSGESITVAKPAHLRGDIATRTVSSKTQEIFPAYATGDILLVVQVDDTGVAGETWADLNWEARRWTQDENA